MTGWEIYINPFWAGVISTIGAQIVVVIAIVVRSAVKAKKMKKDVIADCKETINDLEKTFDKINKKDQND